MRTVAQLLVTFLLNAAWQIALVSAAAAVCAWLLRPTAPWQVHAVWVAALVLSLGLPVATGSHVVKTLYGSELQSPNVAAPTHIAPTTTSVRSELAEPTESSASPHSFAPPPPAVETGHRNPSIFQRARISPIHLSGTLTAVLVGLYTLFVLYRSLKLLRAWGRTRTLVRGAYSVEFTDQVQSIIAECKAAIGVARVQILCSTAVPVPSSVGMFNPIIILPAQLLHEVDKDVLSSAIGHELVHVARHDYILNLLYELIYLPLSFHPAAALLRRRIRQTRELCCDDLVARKLLRPEVYARSLVRLIGSAPLPGSLASDTTIGITDADIFEVRIMSLITKTKLSAPRRTLLLIAASLLLITPCVAAASFAIRFDINGPEPGLSQPQEIRREPRQELQRAREELKRQERELKEQLQKNPNLQGAELEALRRAERELQEASVKLKEEEAQQSGEDRERIRQEMQEKLTKIAAQYPGDEARMREAKQKIAEMEKLYTKDRIREVKESIAQMEKNRPENEERLREAQAQIELMEKLYQDDESGRMIHHVEPRYSEDAREKKIEGTVLLAATIDQNGVPQDIQVTKPLFPSLDANAVEALRQSRFRPYMNDGQPISKRVTVEMHFSVNDGQQNKVKEREREKQDLEQAEKYAKDKDKVLEMRMRKDRVESGREERSRKQVEMTKGATISMDRAIQIATSQYPGKVLACSLGREEDGQVFYHLVIINTEGDISTTRYVWLSATDGHIIKTEKENH